MELIIEIDEKMYDAFMKENDYDVILDGYYLVAKAIANGTPYNPTGDLISREALIKTVEKEEGISWDSHGKDDLCVRKKHIDNAPTVEQFDDTELQRAIGYADGYSKGREERPQGEWINSGVDISGHRLNRCSICNGVYQMSYVGDSLTRWNFCPNCGADMRKGAAG